VLTVISQFIYTSVGTTWIVDQERVCTPGGILGGDADH
jgi:hypothetical protein